jgi:hypothetical protein
MPCIAMPGHVLPCQAILANWSNHGPAL